MIRRLARRARVAAEYLHAALAFLVLVGALAAIVGIFVSSSLLYGGLCIAAPSYLVLLARHINPEGTDL